MSNAREWLEKSRKQTEWPDSRMEDRVIIRMQADALIAVLDLHDQRSSMGDPWCVWDNEDWPCATRRIINKALGVTDE